MAEKWVRRTSSGIKHSLLLESKIEKNIDKWVEDVLKYNREHEKALLNVEKERAIER